MYPGRESQFLFYCQTADLGFLIFAMTVQTSHMNSVRSRNVRTKPIGLNLQLTESLLFGVMAYICTTVSPKPLSLVISPPNTR